MVGAERSGPDGDGRMRRGVGRGRQREAARGNRRVGGERRICRAGQHEEI
jgi:hypothetical protein